MELMAFLVEILPSVGFPIICVCALGWFVYKFYTDSQKQNQEHMAQVQARCAEREEKLYKFIQEQSVINAKCAEVIAQYEVKLDDIKADVKDIKSDITEIKAKQA